MGRRGRRRSDSGQGPGAISGSAGEVLGDPPRREPHFVVRGIVGDMGAVRARAATETRADADKVCAALRAAAWSCDVMHN